MQLPPYKKLSGIACCAAFAALAVPALAADPVKVVYHVSDGTRQASRALVNIRNHIAADPTAKITVVALGGGIQFLLDEARDDKGASYREAIQALSAEGVDFRICNNTLSGHNVPQSDVVREAKIVPSGVAEIARLQAQEGFVYIRP